jgi:hypothetical protein
MPQNPQYDYDWGPNGPLAPLHDRAAYLDHPVMISPPVGWVPLVLKLNEDLVAILPDYTIAQVKEKFAGLRYYIDSFGVAKDDPRIALARELIAEAESDSQSICQVCGEPGRFRDVSWNATLCDKHAS